jgi:hypothetical protein
MIRRVMSRRNVKLVLCSSMVADDDAWIDRGACNMAGLDLSRDSASIVPPPTIATASTSLMRLGVSL